MKEATVSLAALAAGLVSAPSLGEEAGTPRFTYKVECIGPDGERRWAETFENLVTTEGKNDLLTKYFKGSGYTAAWYLGLKGAGTAAAGHTLASHAAWAEATPYTGNRKALTFGTASAGSLAADAVSFAITADATVAGAFCASAASGTSGTLYSAGDFTASRDVKIGDTLNVTLTVSIS